MLAFRPLVTATILLTAAAHAPDSSGVARWADVVSFINTLQTNSQAHTQ